MVSGIGEDLRKILLAGLGAAATTAEKGKQMIEDLVEKGELTLEQGKVLNEELKRNMKDQVKKHVTVTVNQSAPTDVKSVKEAIAKLNPNDLEQIKQAIAKQEKMQQTEADGQKDNVGE